MRAGQPSKTALGAAAYRAIHQTRERAAIFSDPFAVQILDDETRAALDGIAADPALRPMRLFIVARSRFSEEALATSVARGVRQVAVLGAGLDTFSLRNPFAKQGVRVFEVDHPATQAWKRERLAEAGLALPASLTFAPVDFERQSLAEGLARAGLESNRPAFFQWLGVVPYLTSDAISATLDFIAGVPGSAVAFDYTEPFQNHAPERRASLMTTAERAAARGEPWLSFFDPGDLDALLRGKGFADIEDLGFAEMVGRFSPVLAEGLQRGSRRACNPRCALVHWKRLAQETRALQPVAPGQVGCLGDADPHARHHDHFGFARMDRKGRRIEGEGVVLARDAERFCQFTGARAQRTLVLKSASPPHRGEAMRRLERTDQDRRG